MDYNECKPTKLQGGSVNVNDIMRTRFNSKVDYVSEDGPVPC